MTVAEIHGKISSSGSNISDRREDLLTSDVFGCLRYIPFEKGLQKLLTQAQLYTDQKKLLGIDNSDGNVSVEFWPRLENNSEPDVLIRNGDHLIIIEVKYLSGKSGNYETNQDNEDSVEASNPDQLARLFRGLMSDKRKYTKRSLIYLTAHRTLPIEDITDGYNKLDDSSDTYEHNVYWLSWFKVYKTISELLKENSRIQDKYWRIVLCDIQRLLHRKGLRQFEGFEGITDEYEAIGTFYPTDQPIFYRSKKEAS